MRDHSLSFLVACVVVGVFGGATLAQQGIGIGTGGVAQLWEQNCLRCHGDRGQGGGAGTKSLLTGKYDFGGSDRELFTSIKDGRPEMGMEAFGQTLKDEQVWGLVVYLRELQAIDARKKNAGLKPDAAGVYTSQRQKFKVEKVVTEGLSVPWSVEWLPDERMLVTNREGELKIRPAGGGKLVTVKGTPEVAAVGQGGLMDVAAHPDFAKNGWVYLAFTKALDGRKTMTAVVRGKLSGTADAPVWGEQQTIFEANKAEAIASGLHFGCRLVFTEPQGDGRRYLYFSIGERGSGDHAQNIARPNGKVHRVWDDGEVPSDNPFNNEAGREKKAYATIWSFGHRNPQGLALDLDGNLWDTEHGPRGGDELNLIEKGGNYGWPIVTYGINYNGMPLGTPWPETAGEKAAGKGIKMPAYWWTPSIGASGLDVARGEKFKAWRGDLFAGGLSGMNVDRIRVKDGAVVEREEILYRLGRVRDVAFGPDGLLYVVLNDPDEVVRLVPVE